MGPDSNRSPGPGMGPKTRGAGFTKERAVLLSPHYEMKRLALARYTQSECAVDRQPDGLIVMTLAGETFKGHDIDDVFLLASMFVTRPEPTP